MSIKRYVAEKDTTITNAFKSSLTTRAEEANMGQSDSLEIFSIYGQATTSSVELSRILVQFPISDIQADRASGDIGASGSVQFILKLSNARHPLTTPRDFDLVVEPISSSWEEGFGLDMEQYKDEDQANWLSASSTSAWTTEGGDFHTSPVYTSSFPIGNEGLQVDITDLVEEWLTGSKENYGVGIRMSPTHEGDTKSFYTKKFFSRGSEYFFERPWVEARTDTTVRDQRNNFYASSSLVPAEDNLNTLFLYNRVRGELKNIPSVGTGSIFVSLYSGSTGPVNNPLTLSSGLTSVTGGYHDTGIYTASVGVDTSLSWVYDVWHDNLGRQFHTGSRIDILDYSASDNFQIPRYVTKVTNLKPSYKISETARFRLFVRDKDWCPTIYTVAIRDIENLVIDNAYYRIFRTMDSKEVIPYGTGSYHHTRMSYDGEGNYFDFDMSLLEPGYEYGIGIAFRLEGKIYEQNETFQFKVRR